MSSDADRTPRISELFAACKAVISSPAPDFPALTNKIKEILDSANYQDQKAAPELRAIPWNSLVKDLHELRGLRNKNALTSEDKIRASFLESRINQMALPAFSELQRSMEVADLWNTEVKSFLALADVILPAEPIAKVAVVPAAVETAPALPLFMTIRNARTALNERLKTSLSAPISEQLTPNEEGVPYTDLDKDPPQVASIKKLINSLYYAENAAKAEIWQKIDSSSKLGMVHSVLSNQIQIAHDLYNVYKALDSFNEAAPEIRELLRENMDLIQPVYNNLASAVQALGLQEKYEHLDLAGGAGLLLGEGVNALQEGDKTTLQGNVLSGLLNQLPRLLNSAATAINPDTRQSPEALQTSAKKQQAIGQLIDAVFSDKHTLSALPSARKAIKGLKEINERLVAEGNNLSEETIKAYIKWGNEGLTALITLADDFERRNYLKPGTLSDPIVEQATVLRDAIEARIAQSEAVKKLPDANAADVLRAAKVGSAKSFIAQSRIHALDESRVASYTEIQELEFKASQAKEFFDLLNQYAGKNLADISLEDKQRLKQSYQVIQSAVATFNVELDKQIVSALNATEAPPAAGRFAGFWKGVEKLKKADISGLMNDIGGYWHGEVNLVGGLRQKILKYYDDKQNAENLKLEIINEAEFSLAEKFKGKIVPYEEVLAARDQKALLAPETTAALSGQGVMGLDALERVEQILPTMLDTIKKAVDSSEAVSENDLTYLKSEYLRLQATIYHTNKELDAKITAALNSGDKAQLAEINADLRHPDFFRELNTRKLFLTDLSNKEREPLPAVDKLSPVQVSSINNLRGNFAAIQEMELSTSIGKLSEYVRTTRINNLSTQVNDRIQMPPHAEDPADPKVVKQIKDLENNLYNLQKALAAFEQMNNDDSLVTKLTVLKDVLMQLKASWNTLNSMTPELKEQYASVAKVLTSYSSVVSPAQVQSQSAQELQAARSNIQKGVDGLFAASAYVADKQQQLADYFGLEVDKGRKFKGYTREQLANPETMKKEADKILRGLEKLSEGSQVGGLWKSKGLLAQLKRFGEQMGELGATVGDIATAKAGTLKTQLYQGVLAEISRMEDDLYLKPGTMLLPTMQKLNVFFESMLSELDLPYEDKLAIIQQDQFMTILKAETASRMAQLNDDLNKASSPQEKTDIEFKMQALSNKLSYLNEVGNAYSEDYSERKGKILDSEFEKLLSKVYIPAIVQSGKGLNEPFKTQYINELRTYYKNNRDKLISEGQADSLSMDDLKMGLDNIQTNQYKAYRFVDNVTHIINDHMSKIKPGENKDLSEFGEKLVDKFRDPAVPINMRYNEAKNLENNSQFKEIAAKSSKGLGLLYALKSFFRSVSYVLSQSIMHKMSMRESYQAYKEIQKIQRGEALREAYLSFKDNLGTEDSTKKDSLDDVDNPAQEREKDIEKTDKFRDALNHMRPQSVDPAVEAANNAPAEEDNSSAEIARPG
ncbi:hypothetical protein [Legionella quinlivanii]|uniref:hypothetical protein n=1 Tax=Legionella quinlivanii TaxID=45073 RepID=UPI002244D817|nr:hypothetical protein [Legionella quinlivanii]MCW8451687.1 hypothetical protein [Legionella quinlivanii]